MSTRWLPRVLAHRIPLRLPPHPHRDALSLKFQGCTLLSSRTRHFASDASPKPEPASPPLLYEGPLASTFHRLKLFSLGSFALSTSLTPFFFLIDSPLPTAARAALATTALLTSGASTALVAYCARPYVLTIRRTRTHQPVGGDASQSQTAAAIVLETRTLLLRKRFTTVYDTSVLVPTGRPFAKWELAREMRAPPGSEPTELDETVAETADDHGRVVGSWIVRWDEQGRGTCSPSGRVVRHFNVHEEVLTEPIR